MVDDPTPRLFNLSLPTDGGITSIIKNRIADIINSRRGKQGANYQKLQIQKAGAKAILQYPDDLFAEGKGINQAYIVFDVVNPTVAPQLDYSIALYMPPSVSTNYQGNWEEFDLAGDKLISGIKTLWSVGKDVINSDVKPIGQMTRGDIEQAAKSTLSGAQGILAKKRKLVNPHMANSYRGPSFRTFRLDFMMMARNASESNAITNIINVFKWAMHPGGTQTLSTWSYPHEFNISFYSPTQKHLFLIDRCMLTAMNVDYTPESTGFFAQTGAPIDVRLSLEFKETVLLTKENFGPGIGLEPHINSEEPSY